MPTKTAWANTVIVQLNHLDRELFQLATQANVDELHEPPPSNSVEFLTWLRGDEPWDLKDNGDSPHDYAQSLIDEWRLHGPSGE